MIIRARVFDVTVLILLAILVISGIFVVHGAFKYVKKQEIKTHGYINPIDQPGELDEDSLKKGPVIFNGFSLPYETMKTKCPDCGQGLYWLVCFAVNNIPETWAGYCLKCGFGWDKPDET